MNHTSTYYLLSQMTSNYSYKNLEITMRRNIENGVANGVGVENGISSANILMSIALSSSKYCKQGTGLLILLAMSSQWYWTTYEYVFLFQQTSKTKVVQSHHRNT